MPGIFSHYIHPPLANNFFFHSEFAFAFVSREFILYIGFNQWANECTMVIRLNRKYLELDKHHWENIINYTNKWTSTAYSVKVYNTCKVKSGKEEKRLIEVAKEKGEEDQIP